MNLSNAALSFQTSVTMGFTLTTAGGKLISTADAQATSFAGGDVSRTSEALINEKADEVVAKLYADYCRNAAGATKPPAAKPAAPAKSR